MKDLQLSWLPSLNEAQVPGILQLFSQAWWTRGRTETEVRDLLHSTSMFAGLTTPDEELVACVRVLTDWRRKAIVMDLIVDESWRTQGVGSQLIRALMADDRLVGVKDIELYCEEQLVGYYESFGFNEPCGTHFMRFTRS